MWLALRLLSRLQNVFVCITISVRHRFPNDVGTLARPNFPSNFTTQCRILDRSYINHIDQRSVDAMTSVTVRV